MKITIVGGGTAGWLAALFVKKMQPHHDVTVIESSAIGIIGAGEGSTGLLTDVIENTIFNFGCNEEEFIRETGATIKLGIKHKGWHREDLDYHYYGSLDTSPTSGKRDIDYIFAEALIRYGKEGIHRVSHLGNILEENKNPFFNDGKLFNRDVIQGSYHFDAHKVGKYFKKVCGESVANIDAKVLNVNLTESGYLESLLLDNGTTHSADFFIDASGFAKLLMTSLSGKWVSYQKNLPLNSAMPFFLPHEDVVEPVTTAWAQRNGWMWQIPTQERYGCGYVFDDHFVTPEQAQAELEQTIGKKIEPIRVLKFDAGRQDTLWIKNCVSIGLAAAFAEPLEATSIHTTIVQLETFVTEFLKSSLDDTLNPAAMKSYNHRMARMYDDIKDFLVLHYQGGRSDSEFWRMISSGVTQTDFVKQIIEMSKTKIPSYLDFNTYYKAIDWPLYSYVLAGLGLLQPALARKELDLRNISKLAAEHLNVLEEQRKNQIAPLIENTRWLNQLKT